MSHLIIFNLSIKNIFTGLTKFHVWIPVSPRKCSQAVQVVTGNTEFTRTSLQQL